MPTAPAAPTAPTPAVPLDPAKQPPDPWMAPVPVRPSRFVSLHREHEVLNVETDLGGIAAFGSTLGGAPWDDLLLSDLQLTPDTSVHGRLGSGRTGVYRGHYLKGVGRTVLCANWATAADVVHHTGVLTTAGAIREFVVSAYLEAKGCADAINPAIGVLFQRAGDGARRHLAARFGDLGDATKRGGQLAGDFALHGMTVKRAGFVRFSNLAWLANHLDFYRARGVTTTLSGFLRRFATAAAPEHPGRVTPSLIARSFYRAVDRTLDGLRRMWRAGVCWDASLHNNFAVDGRFVDIDRPAIVGRPLLGVLAHVPATELALPSRSMLTGIFDPVVFLLHMRMMAWFFIGRFRAIAAMGHPVAGVERTFAEEIASAFERLGAEHVLFSDERTRDLVVGWVLAEADLGAAARAKLTAIVEDVCRVTFSPKSAKASVPLRPRPAPIARSSFTTTPIPHLLDLGESDAGRSDRAPITEEAAWVNRLITELDGIDDVDQLLVRLGEAKARIQQTCAKAA